MGIKILTQRFTSRFPPYPEGCRWCGTPKRDHAQRHVASVGYHGYEPPTHAQLVARKRAWNKIRGFGNKS